jgi:hypothetical protein
MKVMSRTVRHPRRKGAHVRSSPAASASTDSSVDDEWDRLDAGGSAGTESDAEHRERGDEKPGVLALVEDVSSVTGQFFASKEVESLAPTTTAPVPTDPSDEAPPPGPAPALLARKRLLRRVVFAVLAIALVLVIPVLRRVHLANALRPAQAMPKPSSATTVLAAPPPYLPASAVSLAVVPPPAETAALVSASAAPDAPPSPSADASQAPTPEGPSARELQRRALDLLDRGKVKLALGVAQSAIVADPSEAISYLYLGTALQELGRWKDAVKVYSDCVRTATHGPIGECRQLGGRK